MDILIWVVILAGAGAVGYYWLKAKAKEKRQAEDDNLMRQRVERKVKMSDPILRGDIEVLEETGSLMVDDAIALRRQQMLEGRHPEA